MTHQASITSAWDGWELWYFGSDYLASSDVPPEQWRVQPQPPVEPHLWVVTREAAPGPVFLPRPLPPDPTPAPQARAA